MTNLEVQNLLTNYKTIYDGEHWSQGIDDDSLSAMSWSETTSTPSTNNKYGNSLRCYRLSLFMAKAIFNKKIQYGDVHSVKRNTRTVYDKSVSYIYG
ncbi:hypothetical protein SDC9_202590 [bioreactor metagenome]|uniref:Uncharacterized protein n=1 Tax=bioreactor metagenome TaxID=1076179 RepID=A0A645IVN0_9ZZZZ|nr:hypothetical protein [Oscillospiraceae bacterium]